LCWACEHIVPEEITKKKYLVYAVALLPIEYPANIPKDSVPLNFRRKAIETICEANDLICEVQQIPGQETCCLVIYKKIKKNKLEPY
jgi:hypothetical protein